MSASKPGSTALRHGAQPSGSVLHVASRVLRSVAIASAAAGMVSCASATLPGARPSSLVPCPVPAGAPPARTSEAYFLQNSENELRLAGLRPLLHETLSQEVREVRLWHAASFVGITSLLRIRAIDDSVAGELIVFAGSIVATPPGAEAAPPRACRLLSRRPGRLACAAEFPGPPAWSAVLDSLEVHRVWSLPRAEDLPRENMVEDGDGIVVEVRQGSCYRVYSYANPESETIPEYRHAAALKQLLFEVRRQWSPTRRGGS